MKNADMPDMPVIAPCDAACSPDSCLTKREMMAMHMMSGLLASSTKATHAEFADAAVKSADALMAELEKQQ